MMRIWKRICASLTAGALVMTGLTALTCGVSAEDVYEEYQTYGEFYYSYLDDGTIKIAGLTGDAAGDIEIPEEIDGAKVTQLNREYYDYDTLAQIESLTIPAGVVDIGENGGFFFDMMYSLSAIYVSDENTVYSSIEGVLYDKNQEYLIYYPPQKADETYEVPDGVIGIFCYSNGDGYRWSGGNALYNAYLKNLSLPASVEKIGYMYSENLENIIVDEENAYYSYSVEDGMLFDISYLKELIWCRKNITEAIIPDDVFCVDWDAFNRCNALTHIHIPIFLTDIAEYSDAPYINSPVCANLQEITVDENNTTYYDVDGVLFGTNYRFYGSSHTKNDKFLLIYPRGRVEEDYTVPEGTTVINQNAFSQCENLKTVTIPVGVTSIESWAFAYCYSLEAVTILNSECEIDDDAYTIASSATIYGYTGSTAEAYAAEYNRTFVSLDEGAVTTDTTTDTTATIETTTSTSQETARTEETTISSIGAAEIYGDIDLNGSIDLTDAILLNKYCADVVTLSEQALLNADCNTDGNVDTSDAIVLLRFLVRLVDQLPCTD